MPAGLFFAKKCRTISIFFMVCFLAVGGVRIFSFSSNVQTSSGILSDEMGKINYPGNLLPGDHPELFVPGIVSTGKEHSAAMITPDGKEIWFGRMFPAQILAMSFENDRWSSPRVAAFSGTYTDLYPFLSPDGNTIFFASTRPVTKDGRPLSRGSSYLWQIERGIDGWKEPRCLGQEVNFGPRQGSSAVSSLGTLIFVSRNPRKPGDGADLFVSHLSEDRYSVPESMGANIDHSGPDHSPYISPDESYLIFSSFRGGYGLSDLYICFRTSGGEWTTPRNLGKDINSSSKDEYPYVSPDGKIFFFNSNRVSELNSRPIPDGPGNIYWMKSGFIEKIREEILHEK